MITSPSHKTPPPPLSETSASSSSTSASASASASASILEERTGTAVLLNIPKNIRRTDVAIDIQKHVEDLVPRGNLDEYNPRIFVSYATGNRPGQDEEGCGPGMYYTKSLVDCFNNLGWETFTGLHVGPFVNWRDHYIGKLKNKVADVLIVVLTPAFFRSKPCLDETYTAIMNGVRILPVSFEYPWIDHDGPWPTATAEEQLEAIDVVMTQLTEINSYPKPPSTVIQHPAEDLLTIFKKVNQILQKTPYFHRRTSPPLTMAPSQSSDESERERPRCFQPPFKFITINLGRAPIKVKTNPNWIDHLNTQKHILTLNLQKVNKLATSSKVLVDPFGDSSSGNQGAVIKLNYFARIKGQLDEGDYIELNHYLSNVRDILLEGLMKTELDEKEATSILNKVRMHGVWESSINVFFKAPTQVMSIFYNLIHSSPVGLKVGLTRDGQPVHVVSLDPLFEVLPQNEQTALTLFDSFTTYFPSKQNRDRDDYVDLISTGYEKNVSIFIPSSSEAAFNLFDTGSVKLSAGLTPIRPHLNAHLKEEVSPAVGVSPYSLRYLRDSNLVHITFHDKELPTVPNGTTTRKPNPNTFRAAEGGKGTLLPDYNRLPSSNNSNGRGGGAKKRVSMTRAPSAPNKTRSNPRLVMNLPRTIARDDGKQRMSHQHLLSQTHHDTIVAKPSVLHFAELPSRQRASSSCTSDDEYEDGLFSKIRGTNGVGVRRRRIDNEWTTYHSLQYGWPEIAGPRRKGLLFISNLGCKLSNVKLGNMLQVVIILAMSFLVWDSHHETFFAVQVSTQYKDEDSLMLLHLQRLEQQSINLHETLGHIAESGMGTSNQQVDNNNNYSRLQRGGRDAGGGGVYFDLQRKQTQRLYQMEEELNSEEKKLQSRIQQLARRGILHEFGEGPIKVSLELDFGTTNDNPKTIAILLWHDTPYAAWTWLEQIESHVWDGGVFNWEQGRAISASPSHDDLMGIKKLQFVEQSQHGHEPWSVGLHQNDSGKFSMYINLADNSNLHKHETCVGKVIEGFDALQWLIEVLQADVNGPPIHIRKATAMPIGKAVLNQNTN